MFTHLHVVRATHYDTMYIDEPHPLFVIHSDGTPPEYFPQIGTFKYKLLL